MDFDPDKVQHIVSNLITNAIKFTRSNEGDVVQVAVSKEDKREGGQLVLSVGDTGVGISAEHLPKIFDRYYQAENDNRTSGTGPGP